VTQKAMKQIVLDLRSLGIEPILYGSKGVSVYFGEFQTINGIDLLLPTEVFETHFDWLDKAMLMLGWARTMQKYEYIQGGERVFFAPNKLLFDEFIITSFSQLVDITIDGVTVKSLSPSQLLKVYKLHSQDPERKAKFTEDSQIITLLEEKIRSESKVEEKLYPKKRKLWLPLVAFSATLALVGGVGVYFRNDITNLFAKTTSSNSSVLSFVSSQTSSSVISSVNSSSVVTSSSFSSLTPLSKPFSTELKLPVIMYHHIKTWEGVSSDDKIEQGLRVAPAVFEGHLSYIKNKGYTTITTDQLYDFVVYGKKLPEKPILLTFDDGYDDAFTNALPVLKKFNMVGDFAVITGKHDSKESGYMSWEQIKALSLAGMSISSHTVHHCELAKKIKSGVYSDEVPSDSNYLPCPGYSLGGPLTKGQIEFELKDSMTKIENNVGKKVTSLIYPIGAYNPTVIEIAKKIGYTFAFTVIGQSAEVSDFATPLELTRYRAFGQDGNGSDGFQGFFAGGR
jgi:peptidoglycan/xylan/chitin deacetylase (PgdA/CDA1 family)